MKMKGGTLTALNGYFDALEESIQKLRDEIRELRADTMRFKGTWSSANDYTRGDVVLRDGQSWHCNREGTTARPGTSDDWSLLHKVEKR